MHGLQPWTCIMAIPTGTPCTVRSNLSLEAIHLFLLVAYSHHSLEFCIRAIDRVCYIITTKYTYTTYAQKINSLLKHCRQLFIPFWTEQQKPQNNYLLKKKITQHIPSQVKESKTQGKGIEHGN